MCSKQDDEPEVDWWSLPTSRTSANERELEQQEGWLQHGSNRREVVAEAEAVLLDHKT